MLLHRKPSDYCLSSNPIRQFGIQIEHNPNIRIFFDKLANKLNVQNPSDWLRVSIDDVQKNGGWFENTSSFRKG
jgi:hypothetical protein